MIQVNIHTDSMNPNGVLYVLNPDGGVRGTVPCKFINVQLAAGCIPSAQVQLDTLSLKLNRVDAELYVDLGGKNYRLVDEDTHEVVGLQSGRNDTSAFPDNNQAYVDLLTEDERAYMEAFRQNPAWDRYELRSIFLGIIDRLAPKP